VPIPPNKIRESGQKHRSCPPFGDQHYVTKAENVILLGPTGLGKTHLATGLGAKATQAASCGNNTSK
jgi:DNA replication protein DnaC